MDIKDIVDQYNTGSFLKFHCAMEDAAFKEILNNYDKKNYICSACGACMLFEKIFSTFLARHCAFPPNFKPAKNNLVSQLKYLKTTQNEIDSGKENHGLSFKEITQKLTDHKFISNKEKIDYNNFYDRYRNPIAHGLQSRLYKDIFGEPNNTFQMDVRYEEIYKKLSEIVIEKIYNIMFYKKLLKT
ncbi:MAG TPA: hypothetical protein P5230_02055 [Candidatus Magasanikbacteria bacterium]|nr:hypothetical protein [Candidatus Magasanikbacteria bacterium]